MITWARRADVRDGKQIPATEFALRIAGYIKEKHGQDVVVHRNVTGHVNRLYWSVTYDSLADYETAAKAVEADEGIQQMLAESAEMNLFFANSIVDSLYQSIP